MRASDMRCNAIDVAKCVRMDQSEREGAEKRGDVFMDQTLLGGVIGLLSFATMHGTLSLVDTTCMSLSRLRFKMRRYLQCLCLVSGRSDNLTNSTYGSTD